MKNLYRVSLIILLGLEVGFAQNSFGKPKAEPTWQEYKEMLLGPSRDDLMFMCMHGREVNSVGFSAFDPMLDVKLTGKKRFQGSKAFLSGKAAAMFEVCPDVK